MKHEAIAESHAFLRTEGIFLSDTLLDAYREPHRVYHGLDHIEHMLAAVNSMADYYWLDTDSHVTLHLATWYHDVIYEVGASDNEERSAGLALDEVMGETRFFVHGAVLATKRHIATRSFLDAIVVDADLYGLSTDAYDSNADKVRAEYLGAGVTEEQFVTGRIGFLESFLARPTIYLTSWGAQFEPLARRNMRTELETLASWRPYPKEQA